MQKQPKVVSIDAGDHRARVRVRRDRLIEEHIDLVKQIASRVHAKLPSCFALEDLISTGYIALIDAATQYRPDYQTKKTATRAAMPFPAFARKKIHGAIVESTRRNKYTENTRPAIPQGIHLVAPQKPSEPFIKRRVQLALRDLPEQLQLVVTRHFFEDVSLQSIADEMGISRSYVSLMKKKAVLEMAHQLRDVA